MSVIPIESGIYSHSMFSETFKTCLREQENGISASHEFHFMIFFFLLFPSQAETKHCIKMHLFERTNIWFHDNTFLEMRAYSVAQ